MPAAVENLLEDAEQSIWLLSKTYCMRFMVKTKGKKRTRTEPGVASMGKCAILCAHVSVSEGASLYVC